MSKEPTRETSRDGIVKAISVVLLFAFLASTVQEGCRQSPWLRSSDVYAVEAPENHHPQSQQHRPTFISDRVELNDSVRASPAPASCSGPSPGWHFCSSTSELEGLVVAHWCAGGKVMSQDPPLPEVRIAPDSPLEEGCNSSQVFTTLSI